MHPSRAVANSYGTCLVAAADLEPGAVVERFEGRIVRYRDVPPAELCHALLLDGDDWLIPESAARYLNHSCDPNCAILDSLEVVAIRAVCAGEELTICYNGIDPDELARDPAGPFWDRRWTFRCRCGSGQCVGMIDGYVARERADLAAARVG